MKKLILSFIFLASPAVSAEITITKKFCEMYVVDHAPAADVAYKPAAQTIGPSVDVNGSIRIKTPSEFNIPVHVDLGKYLGVPPQQTEKNHQTITSNLSRTSILNNQLVATEAAISANKRSVDTANTTIETELSKSQIDNTALNTAFTQATTDLQTAINNLNQNPGRIEQTTSTLTTNTDLLKKQFNPYEEDAIIQDRNRTFKDNTQSTLVGNQSHIDLFSQQVSGIENSLNKNIELFNNSPQSFKGSTDFDSTLSSLQNELAATKQNVESLSGEQQKLNALNTQISTLNNTKLKALDYADLGNIRFNLEDGRFYFNDQPLFSEDENKIKQACKVLSKD